MVTGFFSIKKRALVKFLPKATSNTNFKHKYSPTIGLCVSAHCFKQSSHLLLVLIRLYCDAVYQERRYGRSDIDKDTYEVLNNK